MNKIKLAICMKDLEYQSRFVNCFMNHYSQQYELHVFTEVSQLKLAKPLEYTAMITEEYTTEELAYFVERGEIILNLREEFQKELSPFEGTFIYAEKYQELYKIVEVLERLLAEKIPTRGSAEREHECECIGIYSLTQECYQLPFMALLGKLYGEQEKVVILDLQPYSGIAEVEEGMASMGLEDLLSVVTTGNYSRNRILDCIRHEANWDYVCAIQNNQCLAEGNQDLYKSIIEFFTKELGYRKIIINFGSVFPGQIEVMDQCRIIYFLHGKDCNGRWREERFFQELLRQGRDDLVQRIQKIEIPQGANRETSWRTLAEKWSWTSMRDLLKSGVERENVYGAAM